MTRRSDAPQPRAATRKSPSARARTRADLRAAPPIAAWLAVVMGTACAGGDDASPGHDGTAGGTASSTSPAESTAAGASEVTGADGEPDGTADDPGASEGPTDTGATSGCETEVEPTDTIVVTDAGPVMGAQTEAGPVAFLGLPYAAPPVGDARWAPPLPPACEPTVRDATEYGPVCVQLAAPDGAAIGDEDCLHLNVWTPAADDGARPVMVFIHGGGNALGSAADPLYDGADLADAGDVVVITLNYRLGALGWLNHPALDAANFGLLDQIQALSWVAAHAERFGGDPDNVTIFGESAGAVNVCTLLGSPLAAGRFHRAIVQSGGCNHRDAASYRTQLTDPFVDAAGCGDDDDPIACLRDLDAAAVVATEPTGFPSVAGLTQGWGPVVDPASLPMASIDAMNAGTHNIVPTIIGANADETANESPPLTAPQYEALVVSTFGMLLGNQILDNYPVSDYGDSGTDAWTALISDLKFICPARRTVRAAAAGGTEAWRYHFAYDGYTTGPLVEPAAFHGLELVYIFGSFDAISQQLGIPYNPNADDLAIESTMQRAWTSFARDGIPDRALDWPAYEPRLDTHLVLDVPSAAGQGVRTATCDFQDALLGG